jgi:hypothetical protein
VVGSADGGRVTTRTGTALRIFLGEKLAYFLPNFSRTFRLRIAQFPLFYTYLNSFNKV